MHVMSKLHAVMSFVIVGHTFCHTSTRAAADEGATSVDLMRFFRWSTAKMANKYLDNSQPQLSKMSRLVAQSGNSEPPSELFDSEDDSFFYRRYHLSPYIEAQAHFYEELHS